MLGMDLKGPFPRNCFKNVYLPLFVDYYFKWVELFPLRNATAETICKVLVKDILTPWGLPNFILSDRGSQFVSSVFETVGWTWNVGHNLTSAYHPQTNLTERVNRTFAINLVVQKSTGVLSAELNLSHALRGPLDMLLQPQQSAPDTPAYTKLHSWMIDVFVCFQKPGLSPRRQKRNYDKHRRDTEFGEQDRVSVRAHPLSKVEMSFTAKLAPKWQGPYRMVQQVGSVNYKVVLEASGQDLKVVHISHLKPCYPNTQDLQEQERKHVLEILNQESDEEDFLGFSDTACSAPSGGWVKGSAGGQEDHYSSNHHSNSFIPSVIRLMNDNFNE